MTNIIATQKEQTQVTRRQAPRTKVDYRLQVGLKKVIPAFRGESGQKRDTDWYMGLVQNISNSGMCITTNEPLELLSFVEISVIQPSKLAKKKRYTGMIVWRTEQTDRKSYRYGIEFVISWIRRAFYRKNKKIRFSSR